jgi:hypothetical protein
VADLVRFRLEDGGVVTVEVQDEPGVERTSRASGVIEEARSSFEEALDSIRHVASAAVTQFRGMAHRPDEVEIKFGVRLDARAGAVIAQAGMQGQLEIKVRCTFSDQPLAAPGASAVEEPAGDEGG